MKATVRGSLLLVMACAALGSVGCWPQLSQPRRRQEADSPTPLPEPVRIAAGAEVALALDSAFCDGVYSACLSERPKAITDVSTEESSVLTVGQSGIDAIHDGFVNLEANHPGTTSLRITYTDFFGDEHTDTIQVEVVELERVETSIYCDGMGHSGSAEYPVTLGSTVRFSQEAFDVSGNPIATGTLELVEDRDGFAIAYGPFADGTARAVVAPTEPGRYTWTIVGNSEPVEFVVFPAGGYDLELSEISHQDRAVGVRLERFVDDLAVCIHDGDSRATIEVASGSCLPVVGGVEIQGPLPVDLNHDGVKAELSGQGNCELSAASLGAVDPARATLSIDVDNPPPTLEPGIGTVLGPSVVNGAGEPARYGYCQTTTNLTDGDCDDGDIWDGDCYYDVEWLLQPDGAVVGVDLFTELQVKVAYELIEFLPLEEYAPNNLAWTIEPSGPEVTSSGCNDDGAQVLVLRPHTEGDYELTLSANNAFSTTCFSLQARPVGRLVLAFFAADLAEPVTDRTVQFFVGSAVTLTQRYEDAAGSPLRGSGPLRMSSTDGTAGATIDGSLIHTGVSPNQISISSALAPESYTLTVLDEDGVTGIAGLIAQELAIGASSCLSIRPLGPAGAPIYGTRPVRPQLRLTGDATMVVELDDFSEPAAEPCLRAVAPGTTNLEVAWGGAVARQTWTVP